VLFRSDAITAARQQSNNPALNIAVMISNEHRGAALSQYISDLARFRHILGEWNLGIAFNFSRLSCGAVGLRDIADTIASRLVVASLSAEIDRSELGDAIDSHVGGRWMVDEAEPRWRAIVAELARRRYTGMLSLEVRSPHANVFGPWVSKSLSAGVMSEIRQLLALAAEANTQREKPRHPAA